MDTGADAILPELPNLGRRYQVERELGRGGMGRVFFARDLNLGREVAIKLLAMGSHREDELGRFAQEARAAGSLNHPNILAVHDVGTCTAGPYIVSELLQGSTLRDRLAEHSLPLKTGLRYTVQLALGLAAAQVSMEVDRIIRRCLEKNPDRRYQSAKDLALDLEEAAVHPLRSARAYSMRRWRAALVGLALLGAAGLAGVIAGARSQKAERPE